MNMSPAKIVTGAGLALLLVAAGWFWYAGNRSSAAAESDVLLLEGIALFEQEEYSGALAVLQKIPADETGDWRIPYYTGSAQMMLKDYQAAAAALEQALALNSHEAGVLYALGVSYYKLGKLDLAKAYFASVLEINPNDEHAKGLMDIMSRLEQQSGVPPLPDTAASPDG